ncbi:hypothetical protein SAMN05892883_1800 [Jatrophihabitans sp. GAS493]|uniref:hypothetical protein n=1 Tax=Jatrophihabitans sp. GAS493 TaxID=1907575 RepID=UPI000BB73FFC|nr:hypothetical protein [Jatrophihabitans sp. GAS493]SOD72403.1 hypothetical protein SAMN05892883_1800 [Jatrophihabitans sp. GAS493]
MSLLDDIKGALDFGGMSLDQIRTVAHSVKTGPLEQMADAFDQGQVVLLQQHSELQSAATNVVAGWKGQAADAASTRVLNTATTSRESSYSAQSSSENVRQLIATIKTEQAKIQSVPKVDTSFGAAVHSVGGPVAAAFNPGAVVTQMAATQAQANQHKATAAKYLTTMNDAGHDTAAAQSTAFVKIPTDPYVGDSLPLRMSIPAVTPASAGPGAGPTYSPPGSGGPGYVPPASSGPGGSVHPIPATPTGPSTPLPNGTTPGSTVPAGNVPVASAPPGSTPPAGATPGGGEPSAPGTAAPGLPSSVGVGAGALAGGGALLAAGGLSGIGRGGVGTGGFGSGAALGDESGVRSGGSAARGAGVGGDALGEDGSVARLRSGASGSATGRGFGAGEAAETSGLRGGGLRGGAGVGDGLSSGGYGAGEPGSAPLRAGSLGAPAADLAAGESRAILPGAGGAGARRGEEEELNKRPDYLVETDDIWGDGRLAAPPVLG